MNIQKIDLPFDVPLQPVRWLRAGRLTCMYENGNVRHIRLQGDEILRMIYSAVRDQNWKTASYVIEDEVIVANESAFIITYTATYELYEIRYKASVVIEGNDDTIRVSMKGVALGNFAANRIGLCVLHPIDECAGTDVVIVQSSGNKHSARFPILISPHQPFKDIRQMLWTNTHGTQAQLIFEGDIFETEDQRNWTDASYKTYSRPLKLPYPFDVREGEVMEQTITLKLSGHLEPGVTSEPIIDNREEVKVPFPAIGYSRMKGSQHLSESEIELLRKVPFDHYRITIRLDQPEWINELVVALDEAKQLATGLELVVFFGNEIEKDVDTLLAIVSPEEQYLKSILPLHVDGPMPFELFSRMYAVLKKTFPGAAIGYGTDGFFAALNRNRPQNSQFDFISFSINPQVHANDTRTIIENLSCQADTLKTIHDFAEGKAIHVSPVTFETRNEDESFDQRLHTYFGGWWTMQSIKNLSAASSITFYEVVGLRGIIRNNISADDSVPKEDSLTPVYEVLSALYAFKPVYIVIQQPDTTSFVVENANGDRLIFKMELPG